MLANLLLATAMVAATCVFHYAGLVGVLTLLRNRKRRRVGALMVGQGAAILFIVLALMTLHVVEIWLYAGLHLWSGALPDLETALYFSTSSFTTVGFGDIVLDPDWRIVGAIESANGLLLFGWSTAFLTTTTAQLSTLESSWVNAPGGASA